MSENNTIQEQIAAAIHRPLADRSGTLAERHGRLAVARSTYAQLSADLKKIGQQIDAHALTLPDLAVCQWAESVMRMKSSAAILVIDTASLSHDADILQIALFDLSGELIYLQMIRPGRSESANSRYTGLTMEELGLASPLVDTWNEIIAYIGGYYIIAYGLEWIQDRLNENAAHYGLKPLRLVGECLLQKAMAYHHQSHKIPLSQACALVGGPSLSLYPRADERARAQVDLLGRMAMGMTAMSTEDDGLGNLDEHPF